MVTFHDLVKAFQKLAIDRTRPVIVHSSLSSFGWVNGGAATVIGALLTQFDALMMPTFTYKTMLVPEVGPPDNGLTYGVARDSNLMAEFFRGDMPADRLMGYIPDTLRQHPAARRSSHPIMSFSGIGCHLALAAQTLSEPLAPIRMALEAGGWVLLVGVDHTVNTSLHYAEKLAGRKQFIRWALTRHGVVVCSNFPGCSDGFNAVAPALHAFTRQVTAGEAVIQAFPLARLIPIARSMIEKEPLALLCDHSYCERCQTIRTQLAPGSPASQAQGDRLQISPDSILPAT